MALSLRGAALVKWPRYYGDTAVPYLKGLGIGF